MIKTDFEIKSGDLTGKTEKALEGLGGIRLIENCAMNRRDFPILQLIAVIQYADGLNGHSVFNLESWAKQCCVYIS